MKRSEIFFTVLLVPLDFAALLIAFLHAYTLRNAQYFSTYDLGSLASRLKYDSTGVIVLTMTRYLHYLAAIIPAMVLIFALVGLYAIRSNTSFTQRLIRVTIGVSGGEFFILLLFLLKKDFFLPRSTVLLSWVLGIIYVMLGRTLVRSIQRLLYTQDIGRIKVLILGQGAAAHHLAKTLGLAHLSAYQVSMQPANKQLSELLGLISNESVDEVIVASEQYTNEDLTQIRNCCLEEHVGFSFVPSLLTELQSNFEIRELVGLPVVEVRPTSLEGWGRVQKRIFDVMVSVFFIVLFSPLYAAMAIVMKITSPGPLLFRHPRLGKNGTTIYVAKFRSMRIGWGDSNGELSAPFTKYLAENPDAAHEWHSTMKLKHDPRISTFGLFMRKTRLDELPQFFNVLSGSLSIVGPRPIIQSEIERFGEKARILFSVRPGITGLWQVHGGSALSYDERVTLNSYYIEHWSLLLDFKILLQTIWLVFADILIRLLGKESNRGAY